MAAGCAQLARLATATHLTRVSGYAEHALAA